MKKKHKVISFFLLLVLLILGFAGYATYKYLTNVPPEKEIKSAIDALSLVKKAQANKFAAFKYSEAEKAFEEAMNEWKIQNEKFFLSRDYSRVRLLADSVIELCNSSITDASVEKKTINNRLNTQLNSINKKIQTFQKYYKNLPLEKSTFQQFSKARLKYEEADANCKDGNVYEAQVLANESENLINKSSAKGKDLLERFFKDFPEWQRNVKLAKELSRKGNTVVLVNKLESTCTILKSGKTLGIFEAEFGQNWTGDKIRMGDKATPEGVYKVHKKKKGNQTKYYKSLLINYPNDEDKARFAKMIKSGAIPRNSKIGNLIEIHGNGGKGVHWTDGCIAVSDEDMDKIFNLCSISTPIIIVGSEKPLNEYFK